MNRFLTLILMGALSSFALIGCDDDKSKSNPDGDVPDGDLPDGDVPDAIVEVTTANVFVVHSSPKTGDVDVYVTAQGDDVAEGATPAAAGFAVGDVAKLEGVDAGEYTVHVFVAGDDPQTEEGITADIEVVAGEDRTYAAVDGAGDSGPSILALNPIVPDADASKSVVYAVHGAADVGTVDVYSVIDEVADQLLIDDFAVGAQGPGLALPAATYVLGVETNDDQVTNDTNDGLYTVTFTAPVSAGGLEVYAIVILDGEVPKVQLYLQGGSDLLTTLSPDAT